MPARLGWLGHCSIVAVLGAALFGPADNATADVPPDGPPDGGQHNYCFGASIDSNSAYYIGNAMPWLVDHSQVAGPSSRESCDRSRGDGDLMTDVFWTQTFQSGPFGRIFCYSRLPQGNCDQFEAWLYRWELDNAYNPHAQKTKTTCHELGHTVGLEHYPIDGYNATTHAPYRQADCMVSGEIRPYTGESWYWQYGAYHTGEINRWF